MLSLLRRVILFSISGIGCLVFSSPIPADEAVLSPGQGYMLIRLHLTIRERVDVLAMSDVDQNHTVTIHSNSFEPAGLNAWMALVPMPAGRYFWSEYQPAYGMTASEVQRLPARYRRSRRGSASDTFEIVAGAVNYVGDWTMRIDSSRRPQLNPIVEFNKSTLERYVTEYPGHANQYRIYLSAIGKEALSLDELAKTTE